MKRILNSHVGAGAFLLGALMIGWRVILGTAALALHDDAYTYILLVAPIFAAMLYLSWQDIQKEAIRNISAGSFLLIAAIVIAGLAYAFDVALAEAGAQLSVAMFALVLWCVGTFVFWFGIRASRIFWFPLCFLFFTIPLPHRIVDALVAALQYGSASAARCLFAITGVPVLQIGNTLAIPGLTLHVAQECSSIRSSTMFVLTTIVLAHLLLRSPWWKIVTIAFTVPLSIAKNALRIWTIAMLGTRVDPGYLTGRLHRQGGIVFFAIALLVMFTLLWMCRKNELNHRHGKPHEQTAS